MFLNDACDVDFDLKHRPERPIPSGLASAMAVWMAGMGCLTAGLLFLVSLGGTTPIHGSVLIMTVLCYDVFHKRLSWAPVLMALCRLNLYLVALSASAGGIDGLGLWSAVVLTAYVIGLSYLARSESLPGPLLYWPCLFLAAPLVLAWLANLGPGRGWAMCLVALLGVWCVRSLRFIYSQRPPNVGGAISGLLAGIVLVDLLAVASHDPLIVATFIGLYFAALAGQRFIPAT